ncbi:MAG: hypothetical protein ABR567_08955 [Myxococcales bacterium]|nr:hypothetical protein [Myxococcales bacterium]
MADIKKPLQQQPGGAPIGSRQGGAPDLPKDADLLEQGRPHRTRSEKEREKLSRDPNLNQAGNDRGSLDQTQGSQTGNEILPEE